MQLLEFLFGLLIIVQPHGKMRYDTAGDWTEIGPPHPSLVVWVADTGSWRYNWLLALHECVEARLCRRHGITQAVVDAWDMGPGKDMDEPGANPLAPYHREHVWASRVERVAAVLLGVSWGRYDMVVQGL